LSPSEIPSGLAWGFWSKLQEKSVTAFSFSQEKLGLESGYQTLGLGKRNQ